MHSDRVVVPAHAASLQRCPACLQAPSLCPPDSIIAAVASSDNVEVVNEDTVLFPGDKAIVVADNQVIDAVRAAFKGL